MSSISTHGPTYIYAGVGAWPVSVDLTQQMVEKYVDGRGVKLVKSLNHLERRTHLIVVPGGYSMDMEREMGKSVPQIVSDGANWIGICAGGILATKTFVSKPSTCGSTEDKNILGLFGQGRLSDSIYISTFPWSLFPGTCTAPHIVKVARNSADPKNLCAVDVVTEDGKTFKSCHYAGPAFLDVPDEAKILLRYRDPVYLQGVKTEFDEIKETTSYVLTGKRIDCEKPVAALSYPYGKGKIVLTGIHPEIDYSTFLASAKKHNFQQKLPEELEASESARIAFVDQIFSELGIKN